MKRNCDFRSFTLKTSSQSTCFSSKTKLLYLGPFKNWWDAYCIVLYQTILFNTKTPFHPYYYYYYCTKPFIPSYFFLPKPHLQTSFCWSLLLFSYRLMDSPKVYLNGLKTSVTLILIISLTLFPSNSGKNIPIMIVQIFLCQHDGIILRLI